jgi:hypothetical protein
VRKLVAVGLFGFTPAVIALIGQYVDLLPAIPSAVLWVSAYIGVLSLVIGVIGHVYGGQTRYRACDEGVIKGTSGNVFLWWFFRGFRVTADHVVLVFRWGLKDRMRRDSIDDVDALVTLLDDYLDRLD